LFTVILHESNHYNKRLYFKGEETSKAETPRLLNGSNLDSNDRAEGGVYMLMTLFKNSLETINITQARYILNEQNWENFDDYKSFQEDFAEKTSNLSNNNLPLIRLKETSKGNQSYCYIGIKRGEEDYKK
jgi:hypothetical protein